MEDFTRFKRLSFQSYPKESESAVSERAAFLNFAEESGANALLIEAVSLLFKTVEKPDNPSQWLRLFFLNQLPPTGGGSEDELLKESEDALKHDIIQQESKLTCLQVEAHRLEDRLLMLGLKAQHIEFRSPIITNEEEYRRYKDMPEDLRWRIKPDPAFRVTKSDVTLHVQANEDFHKRATMGPRDFGGESKAKDYEDNGAPENYDNYNQLYFAANEIPLPPPPTVEPDDFETDAGAGGGKRKTNSSVAATEVSHRRPSAKATVETGEGKKSSDGQSRRGEVEVGGEGEEQRSSRPKSVSGDSQGKTKTATAEKNDGDQVETEENGPPKSSISEGKLSRKASSKKSDFDGKSEEGGTKNELPYTPDPMLALMEPIDSSFWKRSFDVATHANDGGFDADEEDVILYNDDDEDGKEEQDSYVSFTGVRKQRKFRSQIIGERFWKPDRGKSMYLDSKYDLLLHEHVGGVALRATESKFANRGSQEDVQKEAPSTIAAELSENSMLAREMVDNRRIELQNDGHQ